MSRLINHYIGASLGLSLWQTLNTEHHTRLCHTGVCGVPVCPPFASRGLSHPAVGHFLCVTALCAFSISVLYSRVVIYVYLWSSSGTSIEPSMNVVTILLLRIFCASEWAICVLFTSDHVRPSQCVPNNISHRLVEMSYGGVTIPLHDSLWIAVFVFVYEWVSGWVRLVNSITVKVCLINYQSQSLFIPWCEVSLCICHYVMFLVVDWS